MSNLWIEEIYVNATENVGIGESGLFETFTDDINELYKRLRSNYGKPKNMYLDSKEGDGLQIAKVGWVFSRKEYYEDVKEKYQREVWVRVFTDKDRTPYNFKKRGNK